MNLYVIHDDPDHTEHAEDRFWLAIWADDEPAAIRLYWRYHPDWSEDRGYPVEVKAVDPPMDPGEGVPHLEQRAEVLRLLHFYDHGDDSCSTCGLYEMGDSKGSEMFRVCEGCEQCGECRDEGSSLCHECGMCQECGCECGEGE